MKLLLLSYTVIAWKESIFNEQTYIMWEKVMDEVMQPLRTDSGNGLARDSDECELSLLQW